MRGQRRGRRGRRVLVGWPNAKRLQPIPQGAERGFRGAIVGAAAYAVEGPAESLEDLLPLPVGIPVVGPVIRVSVEFDREAPTPALDDEVNPVAPNPVLGLDAVAAGNDLPVDVPLEVGVEAVAGYLDLLDASQQRP